MRCPHNDCNKYVSVLDLNVHFKREHIEVPVIKTPFEARSPSVFKLRDIRYGVKHCLLLLNVMGTEEAKKATFLDKFFEENTRTLPTLCVLASRISSAQTMSVDDASDDLSGDDFVAPNSDKIIIWVSSNVITNYSYTVAVSNVSDDVRIKYYGPVLQLGQSSSEICTTGQCLILSHFHFIGMSENGHKPLHLNVIIHETQWGRKSDPFGKLNLWVYFLKMVF